MFIEFQPRSPLQGKKKTFKLLILLIAGFCYIHFAIRSGLRLRDLYRRKFIWEQRSWKKKLLVKD